MVDPLTDEQLQRLLDGNWGFRPQGLPKAAVIEIRELRAVNEQFRLEDHELLEINVKLLIDNAKLKERVAERDVWLDVANKTCDSLGHQVEGVEADNARLRKLLEDARTYIPAWTGEVHTDSGMGLLASIETVLGKSEPTGVYRREISACDVTGDTLAIGPVAEPADASK